MVGITALIITLIVCHKLIFRKSTKNLSPIEKAYRLFILSLCLFFFVDSLWGVFSYVNVIPLLYANTVLFFSSMSVSVFLWTRYVTTYIGGRGKTSIGVLIIGLIIVLFVSIMLIINIFKPVLFYFDDDGTYVALLGRYFILMIQEVLFILTFLGSVFEGKERKTRNSKSRFYIIALYSFSMAIAIIIQALFPLLPIYSIGCIIGIVLVDIFIVDSENEEIRKKNNELYQREIDHKKELDSTKALAYNDALTGAYSKYAYAEMEDKIDKLIAAKLIKEFSVVVFDINGLKQVNDTLGHQAGDKYIKDCYKIITDIYKDNKIYRFGGDEFVVVLEEDDYDNRVELLEKFNSIIDNNLKEDLPVVSTGMADFEYDKDNTYRAVFVRADKYMYERKVFLKSKKQAQKNP